MLVFTMIWALFPGIGDLFLALNLKKPEENQCFWLRTFKNLRKINVFAFPEHLASKIHLWCSILKLRTLGGNRSSSKSIYTNSRFTAFMRPASMVFAIFFEINDVEKKAFFGSRRHSGCLSLMTTSAGPAEWGGASSMHGRFGAWEGTWGI